MTMHCIPPARSLRTLSLTFLSLLLATLVLAGDLHAQAPPGVFGVARGIAFEQNMGQVVDDNGMQRSDILYTADSRGVRLFLGRDKLSYVFQKYEGDWYEWSRVDCHITDEFKENFRRERGRDFVEPRLAQFRVDLELLGANPNVEVVSSQERVDMGYRNFYLPHCPNGVLGVRSYSQITYREVYRNIDMVLRSTDSGMKCDFVVRPGGNPADIKMRYVGAEHVELDPHGAITATSPLGYTTEDAPITFTTDGAGGVLRRYDDGVHTPVESRFKMANGIISFDVGGYDSRRTLVIDPNRLWVTYYGGTGLETVLGGDNTEVDRKGNPYFAGGTAGQASFPISTGTTQYTGGGTDAVVVKFYSAGARAWAVIYGGTTGTIGDLAHGITSDTSLNVYVGGHTDANNFPTTSGTQQTAYAGGGRDAFIIKFDSGGVRQWATYYGSSTGQDDGYGFGLDSAGNPVLGAASSSTGLQTGGMAAYGGGAADALIAKFDRASGTRLWATYFGGSGNDQAFAIASDINNNVIAVGWTNSNGLATSGVSQTALGGGYDAFVVKYDAFGNRRWSTYIGGTGSENEAGGFGAGGFGNGYGLVATDFVGNVYTGGSTTSGNLPITRGYQGTSGGGASDGYLVKLDTSGVRLWSTYLGGTAGEGVQGVASNNQGGVLVTGYTTAALPARLVTGNAMQGAYGGGARDAFILKFDSSGQSLLYGTMYGGAGSDEGGGISFDPFGSIIVCGETQSNPFPFFPSPAAGGLPFQSTFGGSTDAWLALICDIENDQIRHTNGTRVGNIIYICWNDSTELYVKDGYRRYQWLTTPDTTARIKNRPSVPGYTVTLTNGAGCTAQSDTVFVQYLPRPNPTFVGPNRMCVGDTATITLNYSTAAGLGTVNYTVFDSATNTPQPALFLNGPTGGKTQRFSTAGTYYAIIETSNGCRDTSRMFRLEVVPRPAPVSVAPGDTVCEGEQIMLTANRAPASGEIFTWSNGRLGQSFQETRAPGSYTYYLTASNGVCQTRSDTVRVLVRRNPVPVVTANPGFQFCRGDTITLTAQPGFRRYQWNTGRPGDTTNAIRVWQTSTITLRVTDTNGCQGETTVTAEEVDPPQVLLSVIGTQPYCEGDTVTVSAGTGFGYYEWSNGVLGVPELKVTQSGKYKVKVRLASAPYCEGESNEITVTFRPRPRVDIAGPLAACVGSLTSYTAPKGSGITYIWDVSGAGGSITSGQGTDSIAVRWGASAGTGKVKLTIRLDSSFCTRDTVLDVAVGSALKPSVVPGTNITLCPGDSVKFSIGNGYVFQQWTDRAGTVLGSTPDLVVRDSGIYFVDVRDANGCSGRSDTIRVRISNPVAPTITALGLTAICPDSSVVLQAPSGYRSYVWQPGGQTNSSIVASDTGTYRVIAVDTNGCTVVSNAISVTRAVEPKPEIVGPNSVCINSTSSYSVRNGSGANSYIWSIGSGIGTIVAGQGSNTITVNWGASSGATSLQVVEQDATTRCSGASDPYFVNINTTLTPTITTDNNQTVMCGGDSLVLRAPLGYTSYTWRDAGGTAIGTSDTLVVNAAGTYSVDVSDGTCNGSGNFTVSLKGAITPTITPSGPLQFCEGDSVELRADPGYARYVWSSGDTTEAIIVKVSGNYSVTVYDVDGCSGTSGSTSTTMTPLPVALLSKNGDTLVASPSSGGYTFRWFRDGALINGAVAPTYVTSMNGRYVVEISTNGLCPDTASFDVGGVALAEIGVKSFEAAPGETVSIPVMLWSEQNLDRNGIRTFSLKFRYDRSLLVPLDGSWPSAFVDTDRVITISGSLPTGFSPGGDPLVTLNFVAAVGKKIQTPLTIEDVAFGEGPVGLTIQNGTFSLKDLCTTGGTRLVDASGSPGLKTIRPNPAQGATELEYETVEDGQVRIVLVNALGQTIPVMDATVEHGRYVVPFNVQQLPSGAYTVILTTPTQRWTAPLRIEE